MEHRKPKEQLYPWLMVLFGAVRFIADWFRHVPKPWKWFMPPTNVWSRLSVVIGVIWLVLSKTSKPAAEKSSKKKS